MNPNFRLAVTPSRPQGRRLLMLPLLLGAMAAWSLPVQAQAPAEGTATKASEETYALPQFVVTEGLANPYQSQQALSASRVAMRIQDIPQTISVVPRQLIEDAMVDRMIDVTKFVTPVVESTLPYGGDRYMIRGFQVSHEFIDGAEISGLDGYSMSIAPYNIERIEVIKGPNAILVPGGSPGGQINPITKSPLDFDLSTVAVQVARFMGNAVSFDINRVVGKNRGIAVRLVGAYWRNNLYLKNQYRNGYEISPSISFQLSPTEKLTLKGDFVQNRETNLGGVPVDPTIGSNDAAIIARGLPRDWSFGDTVDSRHRSTERLSAELLSTLGEHVTSRLYVMGDHVRRIDIGGTAAAISGGGGGSRNPSTGLYEPGVTWTTTTNTDGTVTPHSTVVPVTDPSTWIYTRNNGRVDLDYTEAHLRNDYAAKYDTSLFKSTTIVGIAANSSKVHYKSWPAASRGNVAANNLAGITYPPYDFHGILPGLTSANLGTDKVGRQNDLQLFVYENASFWDDRVQLSGGVSRFFGELSRTDNTGTAIDPTLLLTTPSYNLSSTATSWGVVVKPVKEVSLFYSQNTTGSSMPGSLSAGTNAVTLRVAAGNQKEFGLKTSLLDGTLTASIAHFDIVQQNYPVPNSEWYTLTAQGRNAEAALLENPLYLNLKSKGWEFEGTYSFSKNLTVLANYTTFKMRQPITDVRLRAVPDHAAGLYLDYRFTEGNIKGLGINVGVDFKGDVAGENVTGYTTTKPISGGVGFVPSQPSFLVGSRTLVSLGLSYRIEKWIVRLTVTNALDTDYIMAAGSRTSLVMGEPRAWKVSTSFSF